VGTRIWKASTEEFDVVLGPVFANFVLADEINRAPAKVQSALLEVMAERQVSIAGTTYPAPSPFIVMATQNPIEAEGVYPLPEPPRQPRRRRRGPRPRAVARPYLRAAPGHRGLLPRRDAPPARAVVRGPGRRHLARDDPHPGARARAPAAARAPAGRARPAHRV